MLEEPSSLGRNARPISASLCEPDLDGSVTRWPRAVAPRRISSGDMRELVPGSAGVAYICGLACTAVFLLVCSRGQAGLRAEALAWSGGGRSRLGGITSGERSRYSM